jgi:hypothetical protein
VSTAENQHEETTTPSDIKDAGVRTTPTSPVWPRGVHSVIPKDLSEEGSKLSEEEAKLQALKMDEANAPVAQRNLDGV